MTPAMEIYEELLEAGKQGEDAYAAKAKEILEREISKMPEDHQQRARQIQWKIDGQLRGLTGINRYNKMVELFWEGFAEFHKALNNLQEITLGK